jgi:nucleotide-binding universal stress UspA family protein
MFKQILALVSLSPNVGPDLAVLDAVRSLAKPQPGQPGGRVYLLHVHERPRSLFGHRSAPVQTASPALLQEAAQALSAEGIEVVLIHCDGRLTEEVERIVHEEEIDLVIVGRPERGWGDHGLRVVRLSDAPVLVMPEGARLLRGSAVVGMDFSANALRAYNRLRTFFAAVRPVTVVDTAGEQADAEALRTNVIEIWHEKAGIAAAEITVVESTQPANALLHAAENADLLAVGSRGLTPLAAVLLGSTAEKLGARCPHPLLVYREAGTRRGFISSLMGAT